MNIRIIVDWNAIKIIDGVNAYSYLWNELVYYKNNERLTFPLPNLHKIKVNWILKFIDWVNIDYYKIYNKRRELAKYKPRKKLSSHFIIPVIAIKDWIETKFNSIKQAAEANRISPMSIRNSLKKWKETKWILFKLNS